MAFVVAETQKAARDGAEAIERRVRRAAIGDRPGRRHRAGQPAVWPDAHNNTCFDWETGDKERVEELFLHAAHVTRLTVVNNRIVVNSMEARAALADYTDGRWTLHTNTQGGWVIKSLLGKAVFQVPEEQFRVVTPDVGGGFGMKLFLYAEHVLTCYAARKLGRPVKWASERSEAFLSDTQGRDNITAGEIALDKEGRFLALRTRNVANMGAYLSTFAPMIPTMAGTKVLASVYGFQAIYANVIGVFTNTVPVDAYRGAGRPESNYVVERLIDAAAAEIGMDRVAIRKLNMVKPDAMPYVSAMKQTYDSGDFVRVLDAALAKMDWDGFEGRRAASAAKGKKRGIGMAYYLEATGGAPTERAEIKLRRRRLRGRVCRHAIHRPGPRDGLRHADGGPAGHRRRQDPHPAGRHRQHPDRRRHRRRAQPVFRGPGDPGDGGQRDREGQAGGVRGARGGGGRHRVQRWAVHRRRHRQGDRYPEPGRLAVGPGARGETATTLDAAEIAKIESHTFPNGCHMAEVEMDPDTGMVDVKRYIVCDDVGKAVNPLIVRGQVHGGVAQGYGQAVLEHTAYDPSSGQLLAGSFMDYALPRASDLPDIEVDLIEVPCGTNPLGVKGAGEAGAVGSPPAMINAIVDALASAGVTSIDMPATPEKVWKALQAA